MAAVLYIFPQARIIRAKPITFTSSEVACGLRIRMLLSGASASNFSRALGVSKRTLFRAMAGTVAPSKKILNFLGMTKAGA